MNISIKVSVSNQEYQIDIEENDIIGGPERLRTMANRAVARAYAAIDAGVEGKRPLDENLRSH